MQALETYISLAEQFLTRAQNAGSATANEAALNAAIGNGYALLANAAAATMNGK